MGSENIHCQNIATDYFDLQLCISIYSLLSYPFRSMVKPKLELKIEATSNSKTKTFINVAI